MRLSACLALSLSLLSAGSAFARPRSPARGNPPITKPAPVVEVDRTVRGRVVTPWGWGIRQRVVRIGQRRTFTDGEGRFTFENVPDTYDIEVMERDGRHATAYYGLSRRDPVLGHQAWPAHRDGFRDAQDRPPPDGTGRIAGKVELLKAKMVPPPNFHPEPESLRFSYVFADGSSGLDLGEYAPHRPGGGDLKGCTVNGSYDCELPDFSATEGAYCIAIGREGASKIRALRCGGKLGMEDLSIPPQPQPPHLTIGDKEDRDRILSWDGEGQVFELNLGHDFAGPFVRVYTSKRSFAWSELAALGVDFAWNRAVSVPGVVVTALLPYSSMDDLVSGRGPMAMGTSWRRVESDEVDIRLPGGFQAAALTVHPRGFNPRDPGKVPTCASPDAPALGVGDIRDGMANTRITVRGKLACGKDRQCIERGCGPPSLLLVDAGNPQHGILLQRPEDIAPLRDGSGLCDSPKPAKVEVRATGMFLSRSIRGHTPTGPQYLLDQVSMCAFRPAGTGAEEADEGEEGDPGRSEEMHAVRPFPIYILTQDKWRDFGARHGSPGDYRGRHSGRFPSQLIYRPMTPWAGRAELRTVGEVDVGNGHVGDPLRLAGSFAYGFGKSDDSYSRLVHWGIALDTERGLCVSSSDGRCERRFDQVSADAIYVVGSAIHAEWLVKTGLATGPFAPFALGLRAGGAVKLLFDWCAVQIDILAQVPVNHRDSVPILFVIPAQLQIQLQARLAAYLLTGYRGVLVSGQDADVTIPAGVGLLLGSRWFDVGAEWRFPRMLGTSRTWNERSLFITVALRYW